MLERVHTVVVGAGQAGLSMSYHLNRIGVEHVVVERGRIAERWRSERWDSLAFQFPNWMLRLPGYAYEGAEPEGFMHRDGVVRFIEEYARRSCPPVRCGIQVTGVRRLTSERLLVQADDVAFEALNVVVATGPYQAPVVPAFSNAFGFTTWQVTANRYTNPRALPPGNVLVVGSGGSGWQIAEDLLEGDRCVYLSVGRHRRVPRRYRGRDFGWWQEKTGDSDQIADGLAHRPPAPLLTGVNGGYDADMRALARRGVTLLGSLGAACAGRLRFAPDLEDNLARGDETFEHFKRRVDAYVLEHEIGAPIEQRLDEHRRARPPASGVSELDVKSAGITSVIWAVGYRYDFGWIKCAVFDSNGRPIHRRGVTAEPGLYFLGLPRLYKVKSAFLWGAGEDAAYLAEHIANRE
jgi:putative flavoprotein involved in K+ transport